MKPGIPSRRLVLSIIVLLLVIAAIVGGIAILEHEENDRKSAELEQDAERLSTTLWTSENTLSIGDDTYGFDHRVETFLFVGTDLSGGQQIGNSDLKRHPMADFILLMVLDHTKNSIGYLQIDRNTVTPVSSLNERGKAVGTRNLQICTAHWFGGTQEMAAQNLVKAVRRYLGQLDNIDGYYIISLKDIHVLNQAIGGVDVTLEEDLTDADPAFTKGATVHLTNEQAEHYLQMRKNVSDGTNVARMGRQRNYMSGLFSSVRQKSLEDPQFAVTLWNTLRSIAFTNMNGNDFSRIAQKLVKGESLGIRTVEGETRDGYVLGDDVPHEEFYPDKESLKACLIDLFSLVPVDDSYYGIPEEEEEEPQAASPTDVEGSTQPPASPTDLEAGFQRPGSDNPETIKGGEQTA